MNVQLSLSIMMVLSGFSILDARAALETQVLIEGVTVPKSNMADADSAGYRSCAEFKGTHQNNTVWVTPKAVGGSGSFEHTVIWRFGGGYQNYSTGDQQFERKVSDGKTLPLRIPALRDDVPYVQQTVLVLSKDLKSGETSSKERVFTVSRNVVLSPTREASLADQNCYERFPAFESTIGVLSNGSANVSSLVIKQGIDRLWNNSSGNSWGFYVSPLSVISISGMTLGNILSYNRNYFTNLSKQTSESVEVSTDYQLSPGDYMQIYTQKTRYVNNYDAMLTDACGKAQVFPGAYKMQWWGFAYHAVPINPFDTARPNPNNIGAKPQNTCPAELSTGLDGDHGSNLPFFQTNL